AILENIFANATEDEKQAIALFFEANNEVFNEIINSQSSISNKDHAELNERARKFNINVLQLGIGTVAVVGASALGTTGFGAILAGAGLGLMYDSIPDALNEGQGMINEGTRQVDFDIINGSSSGKSHNTAAKDGSLTFINKQANLLSANYGIRGLDKTDRVLNDIYF
ncbi:hypothetical protein MWU65_17545, partial [Cellulophaga sp. F20128]|uniref:hypothetical protein n=1 Tax=Cellulophaga sp. F20128 TaxID=2926413 RepID=UPI001FF42CD1